MGKSWQQRKPNYCSFHDSRFGKNGWEYHKKWCPFLKRTVTKVPPEKVVEELPESEENE